MLEITSIPYQSNCEDLFSQFYDLPYACWLDSGKPNSEYGRYDIISALPATRIDSRNGVTKIYHYKDGKFNSSSCYTNKDDPLDALRNELSKLTENIPSQEIPDIPFTGGAIGYFSYELGRRYLSLTNEQSSLQTQLPFADMQLGIYHWALIQDHHLRAAYLVSLPECNPKTLTEIRKRLDNGSNAKKPKPLIVNELSATISRDHYLQQLATINEYILAGDCYQVNFAQCFKGHYTGDPYSAYQQLRKVMASPFSAYLRLGDQSIMSLSPERFLSVKNRQVFTQPIKGTIARHEDPLKDRQRAEDLQADTKNRAENLMIVDLLRNDIGHHCIPGSIKVDTLFGLQSFPNVHHLVSDISGELSEESHTIDLLKDCFPGGSITGAPKKRAMEIIDELETGNRGVYCGSIGYINNNGDMDTSIAIRTVSCDGEQLYCWGGGGIVADSTPEDEYQESLDKINKILKTLAAK